MYVFSIHCNVKL